MIKGTLLCFLPVEIIDIIFRFVHQLKLKDIIIELPYGIAVKKDRLINHFETIYSNSYGREWLFTNLCDWNKHLKSKKLVDNEVITNIENTIVVSSPWIIFLEDLTYRELTGLKEFMRN